ncbi:TPA: hypothetical protein TUD12_000253 [Streptococcus equi subsp. zooepidemicus]|nr:hypothetical protein [Streptococcus equi subsp. zooepidemicus]
MDKDIVPELLKAIQREFEQSYGVSDVVKKSFEALKEKKATYATANEFAIEVGEILSKALIGSVSSSKLPDGKMYYNIAKRLLGETLGSNYELISDYAGDVQKVLNEQAKINLKVQYPPLNQNKIDGLVNRLDSEPVFDDVKWLLDEPIVNFSQSIVDDCIRANVEFHANVGLLPQIVREEGGKCCEWCRELIGVYRYPKVPQDVYRRHQRCRCKVDYDPKTGKVRDIWSKLWRKKEQSSKIEERKKIDHSVKISRSRKRALELGIESNPVRRQLLPKSEEKIIKEVSGGDATKGSCSSAAFAYIGNKAGYKVLDFRGGDSCHLFATNGAIKDIANLDGVKSMIINHTNDISATKQLVNAMELDKEYYLATGGHAAIVKKTENEIQYLELQHPVSGKNGFQKLDSYVLRNRFGCKQSHTSYGRKFEVPNILIEAESLGKNEEFHRLLNFINTSQDKQQKGVNGHVR